MTSSQRKSFNTAGKKALPESVKDVKFESDLLKTNEDVGPQSLYGGRGSSSPHPTNECEISQLCDLVGYYQ